MTRARRQLIRLLCSSIESYLSQVTAALPGPARARADILAELRGGLLDAADAHGDAGLAPPAAAQAAVPSSATRRQVAAAFGPGLAAQPRPAASRLTLLVPARWSACCGQPPPCASHIGVHARPALAMGRQPRQPRLSPSPWRWCSSSRCGPRSFTLAATGRLTRWLPYRPRLAPATAAIAGFGAATAMTSSKRAVCNHDLRRSSATAADNQSLYRHPA